jgi:hypothetical protein
MPAIFEQASHLNNEGITSLSHGDIQMAINKLTKLIKWMNKQELSKPGTDLNTMQPSNPMYEEDTHTVKILEADSAIAFNQHVYSADVVFNLALAHQYIRKERTERKSCTSWFSRVVVE